MNKKNSKAQIEVWEWKSEASKDLSELSAKEIFNFINEKTLDMKSEMQKNITYPKSQEDVSIVAEK
ncbi:MAG: hypothetical protein NTV87_12115 [Ignavibacteriae bacterium]|nr:hypothetical protein [Ignavibacteriota bacterium]